MEEGEPHPQRGQGVHAPQGVVLGTGRPLSDPQHTFFSYFRSIKYSATLSRGICRWACANGCLIRANPLGRAAAPQGRGGAAEPQRVILATGSGLVNLVANLESLVVNLTVNFGGKFGF